VVCCLGKSESRQCIAISSIVLRSSLPCSERPIARTDEYAAWLMMHCFKVATDGQIFLLSSIGFSASSLVSDVESFGRDFLICTLGRVRGVSGDSR
jgi:hypothetical protein